MSLYRLGLFAQSVFYVAAGINHFWHKAFYMRIMSDHYAQPGALVGISGVAEILGGLGLRASVTRKFSASGIALMLIVFLDVHQFMLRHPERFPEIPRWILWGRIPLQFLLIAWAGIYARNWTRNHRSIEE